jgi:uncharacterized protein YggE
MAQGSLLAQTPVGLNDLRHIEVNGSAEMEIIPNEFYLEISAKEYMDDNKKKITIEELERKIKEVVENTGIPIESLVISDIESAFIKYRRKKEKDLFLSKTYLLKVLDAFKFEPLLNNLSVIQLEDLELSKTSHTELEKYRLQIKVASVEAAHKKAESMLAPLGAKVGKVIYVHEIADDFIPAALYSNKSYKSSKSEYSNSMVSFEGGSVGNGEVGFQKIKLRYQVNIRFEIEQ